MFVAERSRILCCKTSEDKDDDTIPSITCAGSQPTMINGAGVERDTVQGVRESERLRLEVSGRSRDKKRGGGGGGEGRRRGEEEWGGGGERDRERSKEIERKVKKKIQPVVRATCVGI